MVHVFQMGQFMTKNVVAQFIGKKNQAPVQGDGTGIRTGTPSAFLVADPTFVPVQPMDDGKFFQSEGKIFLRQSGASLHERRLQVRLVQQSKDNAPLTDRNGTFRTNFRTEPLKGSWGFVQPNFSSFAEILVQAGNGRETKGLLSQPFPMAFKKAKPLRPRRPAGQR